MNYVVGKKSDEDMFGKAMPGTDYVANSGTLTFGPNDTVKQIEVEIIEDSVFEGNENIFRCIK